MSSWDVQIDSERRGYANTFRDAMPASIANLDMCFTPMHATTAERLRVFA